MSWKNKINSLKKTIYLNVRTESVLFHKALFLLRDAAKYIYIIYIHIRRSSGSFDAIFIEQRMNRF